LWAVATDGTGLMTTLASVLVVTVLSAVAGNRLRSMDGGPEGETESDPPPPQAAITRDDPIARPASLQILGMEAIPQAKGDDSETPLAEFRLTPGDQ
jgi:hypothetical protein